MNSVLTAIGSLSFGIVAGYLTYRTLARTTDRSQVSDLAAVVAAIGGGAVTALFPRGSNAFAWYAIGLLLGLAVYGFLFWALAGSTSVRGQRTQEILDRDQP